MFKVVLLTSNRSELEVCSLIRHICSVDGIALVGVFEAPLSGGFLDRLGRYRRRHGWASLSFNLLYHGFLAMKTIYRLPFKGGYYLSHWPAQPQRSLAEMLRGRGIRHFSVDDFHSSVTTQALRSLDPDLGIVYGTRILRKEVFTLPRHGCINLHLGGFPRYRGAGLVGLSEVLTGERAVGVTIHQVDEGVDSGPVLGTDVILVEPLDTLKSLHVKAALRAHRLCARVIEAVRDHGPLPILVPKPVTTVRRSMDRWGLMLATWRFNRIQRSRSRGLWWWIRDLAGCCFLCCGYVQTRNLVRRLRKRVPVTVLCYHLVSDRPHPLGVSTDEFLTHLEHLQKHYRVVSLEEAVRVLKGLENTERLVAITFDDGYQENTTHARDLLRLYGIPACFFICSDILEKRSEFYHDRPATREPFWSLSREEIEQLLGDGHQVGSHTSSHADCGVEQNLHEISESKRAIERAFGMPVSFFAFPFGLPENCPPNARQVLLRAGYQAAFSAFGGVNKPGDDPLSLRRVPVPLGGGLARFEAALQGWMPLLWLSSRARRKGRLGVGCRKALR